MNAPKIFLISFLILSSLIASPLKAADETEARILAVQNLFFNCQIKHVPLVDDKISNARVIALALTNQCRKEYADLNKVFAKYNFDNSNERRMYTVDQSAEQLKIEASLHIVLLNRSGKLPKNLP